MPLPARWRAAVVARRLAGAISGLTDYHLRARSAVATLPFLAVRPDALQNLPVRFAHLTWPASRWRRAGEPVANRKIFSNNSAGDPAECAFYFAMLIFSTESGRRWLQ